MSKKIYLLRHAKSDWSDMALADHDRPLNRRGREACDLIGRKLAGASFAPGQVLCSTAVRAKDTVARLMAAGQFDWPLETDRTLYHASADQLLTIIHGANSSADSLLLVGHNPGMQDLALALAADGCPKMLKRLRKKVPTGALLCLEFEVDSFQDIGVGHGRLASFMRPKHEFLQ